MKMATTGQWETVGKVSKKGKPQTQVKTKTQKKAFVENMPRIESSPPVKESSTIYDAFIAKEKSQQNSNHMNNKENRGAGDQSPKKTSAPKKKPDEKKREVLPTLEEAIKMIEVSDLETMLAKDKATFPENPSVWLKDLASVLNLKMDKVPEKDPVFQGMSNDYPVNRLPEKVKKILKNTLRQCPSKTLEMFFEHCVQSMINDMGKGISTYGYRMFIQLILFEKPDILINSLKKYLDMLKANQNRPLRCLSIMWAVGQAGINNLGDGLKVWLEVMLPVLNIRALAPYGVDYLENLFKIHKDLKPGYNVIGFRGFFPVLDLIFSQQHNLPGNLQKKLLNLYPKIKHFFDILCFESSKRVQNQNTISFGGEPDSNLRAFFPSFLARITPNCNKNLKAELLDCLVTCLVVDKQCFSVWRQMYTKHLTSSSSLLNHLVENFDKIGSKLEKKLLKETISAFSVTNEEISSKNVGNEGYQTCVSACKELQTKMSKMRFPWRLVFMLLFAAIAGIISYDVYSSKGFKKSRTCQFLTDTGLLLFSEQVWNRIKVYTAKAMIWLQDNVPFYYAKACEFAGPYLQLFWEKFYALGLYIVEVSAPARAWLNENVPIYLEWVQSKVPCLCHTCSHYFGIVWNFIVSYSLLIWEFTVYYAHIVYDWLLKNVLKGSLSPENIFETLSLALTTIQSYIIHFFQWCAQQVAGENGTGSNTPPEQTAGAR